MMGSIVKAQKFVHLFLECECEQDYTDEHASTQTEAIGRARGNGWRITLHQKAPGEATCPECLAKAEAERVSKRDKLAAARLKRNAAAREYREAVGLPVKEAKPRVYRNPEQDHTIMPGDDGLRPE